MSDQSSSSPVPAAAAATMPLLRPSNCAALQNQMEILLREVLKIDTDWKIREENLKKGQERLKAETKEEKRKLAEEMRQNEQEIEGEKIRFADRVRRKEHQLESKQKESENEYEANMCVLKLERQELTQQMKASDEIRAKVDDIAQRQDPITVEVGGDRFHTQIETLVKHTESIFPDLIRALQKPRFASPRQGDQHVKHSDIFIDRDGHHFKFILNFMRQGEEVMRGAALKNVDESILHEMLCEVRYYRLKDLERLLERKMVECKKAVAFGILVASGYFTNKFHVPPENIKFKTSKKVVIKNANLSKIVFDQVLFDEEATFEGCVMTGALFQECTFRSVVSFKNTDLFEAKFVNCSGVEHLYLKDANMKKVNFSPPPN